MSSFLFVGFDSYVAEYVSVLQAEGLVAFKYRFCSSGHGEFRNKRLHKWFVRKYEV